MENKTSWNGFFDLSHLSEDDLKSFFRDALKLSYKSSVQKIVGFKREITDDYTVEDYIESIIKREHYNASIDRFAYYPIDVNRNGEIGSSCIIGGISYHLYIYVGTDDLYDLVDKYGLPKRLI